jgi:hypothetical protein
LDIPETFVFRYLHKGRIKKIKPETAKSENEIERRDDIEFEIIMFGAVYAVE